MLADRIENIREKRRGKEREGVSEQFVEVQVADGRRIMMIQAMISV